MRQAIKLVEDALRAAFGQKYVVRVQMPLAISSDSEPEPDIAVVTGTPRYYREEHPTTAELVIEIAGTPWPMIVQKQHRSMHKPAFQNTGSSIS